MKYFLFTLLLLSSVVIRAQPYIPFCSYGQLSKRKLQLVNIKNDEKELKRNYYSYLDNGTYIVDSQLYISDWLLCSKLPVIHKYPNKAIRSVSYTKDTLIIFRTPFDICNITGINIHPSISAIYYWEKDKSEFLIVKVIDLSNGIKTTCFLLVFNITDTQNIFCLNKASNTNGMALLQHENLVTDINNNGRYEVNLFDELGLHSFEIFSRQMKEQKTLRILQKPNYKFYIDANRSNWYFDLTQINPSFRNCKIKFDCDVYYNVYNDY